MKNRNISSVILYFIIYILFTGCNKPPGNTPLQLPPATHTGADILAFKLNGQVFIVKGAGSSLFVPGLHYTVYGDSTSVIFATSEKPRFSLDMGSKFKFVLGTYKIGTIC